MINMPVFEMLYVISDNLVMQLKDLAGANQWSCELVIGVLGVE